MQHNQIIDKYPRGTHYIIELVEELYPDKQRKYKRKARQNFVERRLEKQK